MKVNCPKCGEEGSAKFSDCGMPAQCNRCGMIFRIPDLHKPKQRSEKSMTQDGFLSYREKVALYFGVGGAFLGGALVLTYLFAIRDTWEKDFAPQIIAMHEQARLEARNNRLSKAQQQYGYVFKLVNEHEISDPALKDRVQQALAEFDRINKQLEPIEAKHVSSEEATVNSNSTRDFDIAVARYMYSRWNAYQRRDGAHLPEIHDRLVIIDAAIAFRITPSQAQAAFDRSPTIDWGQPGMPVVGRD